MTLDEVCRMFSRSRRTIMRWVDEEKLPEPTEHLPMSWNGRELRSALKRMREEAANDRKHRNGRRSKKGRNGARPRT